MTRSAKQASKARKSKRTAPSTVADVPLSFESPESSNIARAEYDPSWEQLVVTFKRDKQGEEWGVMPAYVFPKVPLSLWIEFFQADSKGKFFAGRIKPLYTGTAL